MLHVIRLRRTQQHGIRFRRKTYFYYVFHHVLSGGLAVLLTVKYLHALSSSNGYFRTAAPHVITGELSTTDTSDRIKTGTTRRVADIDSFHDFGHNTVIVLNVPPLEDESDNAILTNKNNYPNNLSNTDNSHSAIQHPVSRMINAVSAHATSSASHIAVLAPPPLTASSLPWDQSRPPSVKHKTDPGGIHQVVALRVLIDSSGALTPFNQHPKYNYAGAEFYQLKRGSPADAERAFRAFRRWTFTPARDERGHPVQAFLTITLIPRNQ